MRALPLLLLGCLAAKLQAQEVVTRSFAVAPTVGLRIWLPSGRVRLETWSRDSIRVVGSVAKGSNFFGGGRGESAKLGVDQPNPSATNLARGDLVVTVPVRAKVWIKATDATIDASHTGGDLEIFTVGGRVTVREASGVVSVETIDAPIVVRGATGVVRLHTGSGMLTLRDVSGDLTVSSVSGSVELFADTLGDARIETIGGQVRASGQLRRGGFIEIQTHDGNVALYLPRSAVPLLELGSRGGEVNNALGAGDAKLGRLTVRSFRGRINVSARVGVELGKQRTSP